ncbi:MAG: ParB/RepB/Spo0J family partition protein [Eubacteriales bacterium]
MAKSNFNLNGTGEEYLINMNLPGSNLTTSKNPSDISGGRREAEGFYRLPCNKLEVFTMKEEYDFSPWEDEKFQELMASVETFGVLHPIIVRHHKEKESFYEILAGEHRWKASVALGLSDIPAKIITDCDDEKAKCIFALTNIVSRELTIADRIQGWSHYYSLTKGKTQERIAELRDEGLLKADDAPEVSKRQIFRYHQISQLHPDLKEQINSGVLSINSGEQLAKLSNDEQKLLGEYANELTSAKLVATVFALREGRVKGQNFDEEGLEHIFSSQYKAPKEDKTVSDMAKMKQVLRKKLPNHHNPAMVVDQALDFYHKYFEKRNLVEKAMAEYLKNHPEEG